MFSFEAHACARQAEKREQAARTPNASRWNGPSRIRASVWSACSLLPLWVHGSTRSHQDELLMSKHLRTLMDPFCSNSRLEVELLKMLLPEIF
jgi:hypothetical protein